MQVENGYFFMDFKGKKVLVTGGSRRGGAAIAMRFAREGASILIHTCSHIDEAQMLLAALPGEGHQILCADFSRADAAEKLFAGAGKIDVLVNNASFFRLHPQNTAEENQLFRQINYETPKKLMECFVRQEILSGCVVNILDAAIWSNRHDAYTESRRALGDLTLDFALRYAARDLRFNAVAPGPMLPPVELPDSKMEKVLQSVPLRRPARITDYADAVFFLAQCESVTGAILPVDGGEHLVEF